jgi:hypothetical protein
MWHHHAMPRWSLIAFVVSACSHASSPATTTPGKSAAASPCTRLADHLVSLLPASTTAPPDKVAAFRDVIATRCDQDHWSVTAQQCFLAAASEDDIDKCGNQLTQAQNASLDRDGKAAVEQLQTANNAAGAPPAAAAAPPPPAPAPVPAAAAPAAKRATRGAKTSSDPCEGGQ